MAAFALLDGNRVHELIEANSRAELRKRYHADLVARMVDVTDEGVKEGMVRVAGVFVEPLAPEPIAPAMTAQRLAALLVEKGVLAAEDLGVKA